MPALAMLHQIAGRELPADPSGFCRVHPPSIARKVATKITSDSGTENDCTSSVIMPRACDVGNAMFLTINQCVYYLR